MKRLRRARDFAAFWLVMWLPSHRDDWFGRLWWALLPYAGSYAHRDINGDPR